MRPRTVQDSWCEGPEQDGDWSVSSSCCDCPGSPRYTAGDGIVCRTSCSQGGFSYLCHSLDSFRDIALKSLRGDFQGSSHWKRNTDWAEEWESLLNLMRIDVKSVFMGFIRYLWAGLFWFPRFPFYFISHYVRGCLNWVRRRGNWVFLSFADSVFGEFLFRFLDALQKWPVGTDGFGLWGCLWT